MFLKKETKFMKVVVMVHMTKALVLEEGLGLIARICTEVPN